MLISTGYRHPTAGNSPRKELGSYRQGWLEHMYVFRAESAVFEEPREHWPDEIAEGRVKYPYRITLTPLYEMADLELFSAPPEFAEAFRLSANNQSAGREIEDSDFTAAIELGLPLDGARGVEKPFGDRGFGAYVSTMAAARIDALLGIAEAHAELPIWMPATSTSPAPQIGGGEPYLFGTASPSLDGVTVRGCGVLSGVATMRLSELWDWFGEETGAGDPNALRHLYEARTGQSLGVADDPDVRTILLQHVRLFTPTENVDVPVEPTEISFRGGQYFALDGLSADEPIVRAVRTYYEPPQEDREDEVTQVIISTIRGQAKSVVPRLGQKAFKAMVSDAYLHRCALTEEKVRPTLEAAHIRAYSQGGEYRMDNGLLLRSDMHTLYDRGFISFSDDRRLMVSPLLRERFGNGDWLYAREGVQIRAPQRTVDRPNPEFLSWHRELIYQG